MRKESVSFGGIRVDTREWPIVLTEFPAHPVTDADLAGALGKLEALFQTGERSFQITDLSRISEMAPASQRKYSGDWTIRTFDLQKQWSLGGCLVIKSALVRGLVTAVHWLKEPPQPTATVATLEEAYAVARGVLARAGLRAG